LNWINKVDNRHYELIVLIYILCQSPRGLQVYLSGLKSHSDFKRLLHLPLLSRS
jgi:hypothetical protein